MKAAITTTARYVPERIMTNFDLEKMVETSDEWIRTRTGIAERHVVEKGQTSSFMATKVAKILLNKYVFIFESNTLCTENYIYNCIKNLLFKNHYFLS